MISFQQAGHGCYVVPVHLGLLECPHAHTARTGFGFVGVGGPRTLLSDGFTTEQYTSAQNLEAVAAAVAVVDLD
jgi:hypothetical protein